ncbi:MAG TPA: DUF2267 domain-containing protein [Thermoleophilaceae bacterium]
MIAYDEFLEIVAQEARLDRDSADRASRAVLETLAERIDAGEARDLAGLLPPELAPSLGHLGPAQAFDLYEFVRRVAEREGVDLDTAELHTRAVFTALGRAVGDKELRDLAAQLPDDFGRLLPAGTHFETITADDFLDRVARRAGMDRGEARRATDAVLETLAERIAGGEVEDLMDRLPVSLHEPLRRGLERTGGTAAGMSLERFVRRVAEREGTSAGQAAKAARAVLTTLREAVGELSFLDVEVQLPDGYGVVTRLGRS